MIVDLSPIVLLKTSTLLLGGTITWFAYRAYRRTAAPALRMLSLGFGVVTVGSLLAGVADRLLPLGTSSALVVESLFTAVGFAIIFYSLYVE